MKLKLKDDIDFKELDKLDFRHEHCDEIMEYLNYYTYTLTDDKYNETLGEISIDMKSRILNIWISDDCTEDDVDKMYIKLYDLIQTNFIEKAGE